MLEIMLSKLHVTSLAIKEQIRKKLSWPPPGAFLTMAVRGESRGLFLRSSNLGYAHQKAKNLCGALNVRGSERRSCAILWPVQNGNGRALLCLLND